jgi:hypothetical protein
MNYCPKDGVQWKSENHKTVGHQIQEKGIIVNLSLVFHEIEKE